LHTGGATGGLAVVATARWVTNATVVITEHDVPVVNSSSAQRFGRFLIDRLSHAQVAVSRRNAALRQARIGALPNRSAAVLNGVPSGPTPAGVRARNRRRVRAELGLDPGAVVIGSLVRLAEGKGLDDLIHAVAIVRKAVAVELLIVGDGPLRGALERLAQDSSAPEAVHFAGHQAESAAYLDAMDIFALCVPAGSQSIALLEAMSRGLAPVITFGGPEEPVIPEQTGLTAPPQEPAKLAAVLLRLVLDVDLRARLGNAAAAQVEQNFSIRRVADDMLALYGSAAHEGVPAYLRAGCPAAVHRAFESIPPPPSG
jgi:glycosyltransferase involved in cell wall biosynthesis